jgi:hypothetical protein
MILLACAFDWLGYGMSGRLRLAVAVGGRRGRVPGYATAAERHSKLRRLQVLQARLAETERRLESGRVSVCRGGRDLLRKRSGLGAAGLTEAGWRERWDAARLFLTADGDGSKRLGNETIRWNPDEGWLEIRLPAPLAHLANTSHGRYRLGCPVEFAYRGDEVAAQAVTGAVRYDISFDPARGRWYLDASWQLPPRPAPSLDDLRGQRLLAVDLNHGHLAAWTLTPDGNPAGPPVTIPLQLAGLPAGQRDGRLRAAISQLLRIAREGGCAGIAVDPAYTSRWGAEHWLAPLRETDTVTTGHHAAAVVIGRRAQGHRARRREGVTGGGQRTARRRAAPVAPTTPGADRKSRPRKAQRQPPPRWRKTATADREHPPDQATQDRPGPPAEQQSYRSTSRNGERWTS